MFAEIVKNSVSPVFPIDDLSPRGRPTRPDFPGDQCTERETFSVHTTFRQSRPPSLAADLDTLINAKIAKYAKRFNC